MCLLGLPMYNQSIGTAVTRATMLINLDGGPTNNFQVTLRANDDDLAMIRCSHTGSCLAHPSLLTGGTVGGTLFPKTFAGGMGEPESGFDLGEYDFPIHCRQFSWISIRGSFAF